MKPKQFFRKKKITKSKFIETDVVINIVNFSMFYSDPYSPIIKKVINDN